MSKKSKRGGSNAVVKVGFGAKGSTFIPMIVGYLFGFAGDALYNMVGLPGYDQKVGNCNAFSWGDIIQVSGLVGISFLAFVMRSWSIAAFSYGATAGSLTPKFLAAANFPRYGLFNIDPKTGSVAPLGGGARGVYDPLNNAAKAVTEGVKSVTNAKPKQPEQKSKANLGLSVSYL